MKNKLLWLLGFILIMISFVFITMDLSFKHAVASVYVIAIIYFIWPGLGKREHV